MSTEVTEQKITSYLLRDLITRGLESKYPNDNNGTVVGVIIHKSGFVTLTIEREVDDEAP